VTENAFGANQTVAENIDWWLCTLGNNITDAVADTGSFELQGWAPHSPLSN
jgi:hypothetical protein